MMKQKKIEFVLQIYCLHCFHTDVIDLHWSGPYCQALAVYAYQSHVVLKCRTG